MRKHRVLAGILTAIMLLGMVPSALAADTAVYNGPKPGEKTYQEAGIILNKEATELKSGETTLNLTISAPSYQSPVAVEFVLDGTSSLHGVVSSTQWLQDMMDSIKENLAGKMDNVYAGVTVFGKTAEVAVPMTLVGDGSSFTVENLV